MSAPIFISYSSKDQKIAETICRALEARGYDCWIAARDVGPGENFQEAIVKALRSARLMLLVFTSNANNSNEIKKEVVLAGRHHVTVVPVRVEDVVPNDALAYEFATRQWIDLFTDWEREIERLVSQIGSILADGSALHHGRADDGGPPSDERPSPPAPAAKASPLRPLALLIPLVIVLGLGSGAYLVTRPAVQSPPPASASSSPPPTLSSQPSALPAPTAAGSPAAAPPSPPQALTAAPAATTEPAPPADRAPPPAAPTPVALPPPEPPAGESAWRDATNLGTVQALRRYVDNYPASPHVEEAARRIQVADDRAWTAAAAAGTMVALNQYLTQFPGGAHVAQAQSSVAALDQKAADQKPSAPTRRFDGNWQATISCTDQGETKGYTIQLAAQVKDGNFHGHRGIDGKPDSLSVDGAIQVDGSVELFAQGLTGNPRTTFGKVPPGSPVGYHIEAKFEASSGSGSRVELRPCNFTAIKR